jgi:hypothetical protein
LLAFRGLSFGSYYLRTDRGALLFEPCSSLLEV